MNRLIRYAELFECVNVIKRYLEGICKVILNDRSKDII